MAPATNFTFNPPSGQNGNCISKWLFPSSCLIVLLIKHSVVTVLVIAIIILSSFITWNSITLSAGQKEMFHPAPAIRHRQPRPPSAAPVSGPRQRAPAAATGSGHRQRPPAARAPGTPAPATRDGSANAVSGADGAGAVGGSGVSGGGGDRRGGACGGERSIEARGLDSATADQRWHQSDIVS